MALVFLEDVRYVGIASTGQCVINWARALRVRNELVADDCVSNLVPLVALGAGTEREPIELHDLVLSATAPTKTRLFIADINGSRISRSRIRGSQSSDDFARQTREQR